MVIRYRGYLVDSVEIRDGAMFGWATKPSRFVTFESKTWDGLMKEFVTSVDICEDEA
jgi:hypothetical protein